MKEPAVSSQQLRITLAGSEHVVEAGTTAGAALGPGPGVIAARVNGELRDLAHQVADGDVVEPVGIASDDGHYILRHSAAHVMAQAVQELFPQAKLGIGPPVENGFYYDFDVDKPFTPEDLKAIEARMRQIVKQGQRFSRRVVTDEQARAELAAEPYKLELIGLKGNPSADDGESVEVGGSELTIYDNLDRSSGELCWKDLCRGPHLPDTRAVPAFRLMRSGGAYWRGSEKNPQLQRIYGTAWESRDKQDEYLKFLEEAEKRDHRKIGAELDLFSFPAEIGSGLAVFHPKGGLIRKTLEDYSRQRHARSEEHTSELQSHVNLVCRLLLEKKKKKTEAEQPSPAPPPASSPLSGLHSPSKPQIQHETPASDPYSNIYTPHLPHAKH